MDEQRVFLTKEQAIECIHWTGDEGDRYAHVFKNSSALIGCDWSESELSKVLDDADWIEIGGATSRRIEHGVIVVPKGAKYQHDLLFVAHNDAKLLEMERKLLAEMPQGGVAVEV